ncbi:hypothetical protein BU52_10740 [Streptomyces toyocaensis]|uniref:Uncharacterized protein n=1 Tax=Streptomyces toyocaensis TaxID=55952 RepID=A0A081XU42_STRTO|nr:hypothetical protein [Streptomyces toyocaensis]KES07065.1 hypothetical protein BU52_10740 [Streptomyces toyocaensis]
MSRRDNGGDWANTNQAAEWLGELHPRVRAFAFHLRMEGKLPDAWDYDETQRPRTALDRQWIYDNWTEWAEAWTKWRAQAERRHR